ncbi:MAG: nucleotidyl transferase AbiEii/AbiGii toxin family protein [Candidatus Kerfeldbacteria bacterium]|nr:nucleotidyl transferase AbiEii/AbiGii toxin family protein [Candidatus Kerfeldbacteria bacterium]
MKLHATVITSAMKEIAQGIFNDCDPNYYLAGGTALALQIGHRKSIDLDYFIADDIDTKQLRNRLEDIFQSTTMQITFEQKNTLWCLIDGVKISFISRSDALLQPVSIEDSFRLVSIADIAIMKLSAICSRDEYKDYFDLACIAQQVDVRSWLSYWDEIYPNVDPTSWLVALAAAHSIQVVPLDILPSYNQVKMQKVIHQAVTDITKILSSQ